MQTKSFLYTSVHVTLVNKTKTKLTHGKAVGFCSMKDIMDSDKVMQQCSHFITELALFYIPDLFNFICTPPS